MKKRLTRRDFLHKACIVGASAVACSLLPLPSFAGEADRRFQETRLLMGTMVTLTAFADGPAKARDAFAGAFDEMARLIAVFDRHDPASALGVLNAEGRLASAPPELLALLRESARLGNATEQTFNPAIAPVLDLVARAAPVAPVDPKSLADALALAQPGGVRESGGSLRLARSGMRLTLDGIAKGRIADAASQSLLAAGLHRHMVNAGGDIRARGRAEGGKPWSIGVQDPEHPDRIIDSVAALDCGVATSGRYVNFFDPARSRHHLISPVTGESPKLASVTVKAPNAMRADALATALALMPPARAVQYVDSQPGHACLIVGVHGERRVSAHWWGISG